MPLPARLLATPLLFMAPLQFTPVPQDAQTQMSKQTTFEASTDIGAAQVGATRYDPVTARYEVRGGGADVWGTADDFRFTWTQLAGDGSLAAKVHIDAPVTYRLSKGMLMFRQSLAPGSPYADIAVHADGHITLQYRQTQNGETRDEVLPQHNVAYLRIVRHANTFTVSAASEEAKPGATASVNIAMADRVYVGIGVCAHNTDVLQMVTFSRVQVTQGTARQAQR